MGVFGGSKPTLLKILHKSLLRLHNPVGFFVGRVQMGGRLNLTDTSAKGWQVRPKGLVERHKH